MITIRLNGGLGNQMFQYAMARALALHNNTHLLLDVNEFDTYDLRDLELDKYAIKAEVINKNLTIDPEKLAVVMLNAINTIKYDLSAYKHYCELNKELAYKYESYEEACKQIKDDLEYLVENK